MKKIVGLVFIVVFCFSPVTLADVSLKDGNVTKDLVYRGEEWKFHDLVYRGEPIEITVLPFEKTSLQ